jgi:ABC-type dipeptide/oligopeptide/nickel transport system permease subunit
MKDFWAFRTMVTPVIIQIIFWVGVVVCVITGLGFLGFGLAGYYASGLNVFKGLMILILGPLAVRVYCEILIIFFRINETLTEIKHALEGPRPPAA